MLLGECLMDSCLQHSIIRVRVYGLYFLVFTLQRALREERDSSSLASGRHAQYPSCIYTISLRVICFRFHGSALRIESRHGFFLVSGASSSSSDKVSNRELSRSTLLFLTFLTSGFGPAEVSFRADDPKHTHSEELSVVFFATVTSFPSAFTPVFSVSPVEVLMAQQHHQELSSDAFPPPIRVLVVLKVLKE